MKLVSKIILAFFVLFSLCSAAIDKEYHDDISLVIGAFKKQDKKAISALIDYPLNRESVIPAIQNEAELIRRFDEVFDGKLIKQIATSDLAKDWSMRGWRGIMFSNGELWLSLDGKITTINYQTEKEKKLGDALIKKQKLTLHESIRAYEAPILEWKTTKFRIRIDYLGESRGKDNYRYSSWGADKQTSAKPDLVLVNGKVVFEGSGGNHYYEFTNGKHIYRCDVCVLGRDDSPPGSLEVYKGDKLILSEAVVEVLSH